MQEAKEDKVIKAKQHDQETKVLKQEASLLVIRNQKK